LADNAIVLANELDSLSLHYQDFLTQFAREKPEIENQYEWIFPINTYVYKHKDKLNKHVDLDNIKITLSKAIDNNNQKLCEQVFGDVWYTFDVIVYDYYTFFNIYRNLVNNKAYIQATEKLLEHYRALSMTSVFNTYGSNSFVPHSFIGF